MYGNFFSLSHHQVLSYAFQFSLSSIFCSWLGWWWLAVMIINFYFQTDSSSSPTFPVLFHSLFGECCYLSSLFSRPSFFLVPSRIIVSLFSFEFDSAFFIKQTLNIHHSVLIPDFSRWFRFSLPDIIDHLWLPFPKSLKFISEYFQIKVVIKTFHGNIDCLLFCHVIR